MELESTDSQMNRLIQHYANGFFAVEFNEEDLDLIISRIPRVLIAKCLDKVARLNHLQSNLPSMPEPSEGELEKAFQEARSAEHEFFDEFHYHFMGLKRGDYTTWVTEIQRTPKEHDAHWRVKSIQQRERVELMREMKRIVGYRKDPTEYGETS